MQISEQMPGRQEFLDFLDNHAIRRAVVGGLRDLTHDPAQRDLWEHFRYTFEARRQMPWLPESGEPERLAKYMHLSPEDPKFSGEFVVGILGSISDALYHIGADAAPWLTARNEERGMRLPVDDDFLEQLDRAVNVVENIDLQGSGHTMRALGHVRNYVERSNHGFTEEMFRDDLAKGLHNYWEHTYAHGYSGDPW